MACFQTRLNAHTCHGRSARSRERHSTSKAAFVEAHYCLALLRAEIPGEESEAILGYEQTIRINPDTYPAHFNLGLILMEIPGRTTEARAHLQATLRAKPDLEHSRERLERLQQVSP